MAADFKTAQPLEYYRKFLEENIRPDGRDLLEFRKTILNVGSISTAEGSALVKLGNTTVVCGVKAEFAVPSQENPNHGYIVPNVDLPPLCSSRFRPGPPNEQAQVLSQFVADTISNCEPVNLKDLCILEGKIQGDLSHYQFLGCQRYSINTADDRGTDIRIFIQILIILLAHIELGVPVPLLLCWVLYVDVVCLSYDGNITDASLIAAIAALKNTQLHAVTINEESQTPEPSETRDISLTIRDHPVAATFGIFDDSVLFADPTDEEEGLLTGVVTIVVTDDEKIAAVHKPGGSPLPDHKFQECYKKALTRGKEVRDLIQTACVDVDR